MNSLCAGGSRFSKQFISLRNLSKHRARILASLMDPLVIEAMNKIKNDILEGDGDGSPATTVGARYEEIRAMANDVDFWAMIDGIEKVLGPVTMLLRYAESDCPVASKIYFYFLRIQEIFENLSIPEPMRNELVKLLLGRWEYSFTCVQGASFYVDPEFWDLEMPEEAQEAFNDFVLKQFPRPQPPAAGSTSAAREEYESAKEAHTEQIAAIDRAYSAYKNKQGVWGRDPVQLNAKKMAMGEFFGLYASGTPDFQLVCMRLGSCCAGACPAERGFKTIEWLSGKKRGRQAFEKTSTRAWIKINLDWLDRVEGLDFDPASEPKCHLGDDEQDQATSDEEEEEDEDEGWGVQALAMQQAYEAGAEERATRAAVKKAARARVREQVGRRRVPTLPSAHAQDAHDKEAQATGARRSLRAPRPLNI